MFIDEVMSEKRGREVNTMMDMSSVIDASLTFAGAVAGGPIGILNAGLGIRRRVHQSEST